MKYIRWIGENILFLSTLFLLVFIPLYPKKPLLDIVNTWVYIRAEDFVVLFILFIWIGYLIKNKITLNTPLTLSILIFWITGAVATIHGVLIIFPSIADVFSNVAFLVYLRHIEYISLFFIAFSGLKSKRYLPSIIITLFITLLIVILYGFGQKYLSFPAFLTMNEEFAKGIPITLSPLSRLSSTFGGHYDLAAYLVLLIPIMISLVFGIKNWLAKIAFLIISFLGFIIMFLTVSRVSFFSVVIGFLILLYLHKRKLFIYLFPIVLVLSLFLLSYRSSLSERFGSTVKEIDVLIEAQTGQVVGHTTETPKDYFKNKIIINNLQSQNVNINFTDIVRDPTTVKTSTASALLVMPFEALPETVLLITEGNKSTGETLPQGTGYINLSLSANSKRVGEYYYENLNYENNPLSKDNVIIIHGDYIVKRAFAYDLSFTTRFQGGWPLAIEAFRRNVLFGSGYASATLAVDNNYLRILAETGIVGLISFLSIFVVLGIYIKKKLPYVDSQMTRSFIYGFIAGISGLILNAFLIDIFEASKVSFYIWLLTGITVGLLHNYNSKEVVILKEYKKVLTSSYAVMVYLLIAVGVLYSPLLNNYFTGDDFTWFRWVADCEKNICGSIHRYFTQSEGFFYRPGTKVYFMMMYKIFWLNQTVYHGVSLILHFIMGFLVYLLTKKLYKNFLLSVLLSMLFIYLSGYSEAIFWISATGFLFTAVFSLTSLLLFIKWTENKKIYYAIFSVISMIFGFFFHELAIITPLLLFIYALTIGKHIYHTERLKLINYLSFSLPVVPYLIIRYIAQSHWLSGDYNYNFLKLPFNFFGNYISYFALAIFGPAVLPVNNALRIYLKDNLLLTSLLLVIMMVALIFLIKKVKMKISESEKNIVLFGLIFSVVALLPFLGMGNMASRYNYLASVGFIIPVGFVLKRIYHYLLPSGKLNTTMSMTVLISIFYLFHIVQMQQIQSNWNTAGEMVQNFFRSIDSSYQDYWKVEPMKIYFVNVPIRSGEAWVFPVGLEDGLWFTLRNQNISVYQVDSVEDALDLAAYSKNEKIFVFDETGNVTEKKKLPPLNPK